MRPLLLINEVIIVLLGLTWGSFLNVIAYRILHGGIFSKMRSFCPSCHTTISWYDMIPVLSWLVLQGKCRYCKVSISWLYPFVEIITAVTGWCIFFRLPVDELKFVIFDFFNQPLHSVVTMLPADLIYYQIACGLFFSTLIIAVRTDFEAMVIPQIFSLWAIPLWVIFALLKITPISWQLSLCGAVIGYAVLWIVAKLFTYATGKDGLGVGDMELLASIGSFIGPLGAWICLMIASITGTLFGSIYLIITGNEKTTKIPFGPFLALGAFLYILFNSYLGYFFL